MSVEELIPRLERMETPLNAMISLETVKDCYSTEEQARMLGKSESTVRAKLPLGQAA